jgi:hypothetical protein
MTFWAQLERAEQERRDEWLDVEPDECQTCHEVKRGVLLGICVECFNAWESSR